MTEEWEPGTPEHKQSVRGSLAGTLDRWRDTGDLALTPEAGWPLGPPGSSSDTWAVILYVAAGACDAVGRWSEAAIYGNYADPPACASTLGGRLPRSSGSPPRCWPNSAST